MRKITAGAAGAAVVLALALGWGRAEAQTANATANAPAYTPGTQSLSQTLSGALRTISVSGGGGAGSGAAPYIFTPLGYQQLNVTTAATLTVPAGATFAFITVETSPVRYRDDGVAPTTGIGWPVTVGQHLLYSATAISTLQFISQTGTATLDILYYK